MSINFVVGRTARFSMTEISTVTVAIYITIIITSVIWFKI